jgi:hypothetical protein
MERSLLPIRSCRVRPDVFTGSWRYSQALNLATCSLSENSAQSFWNLGAKECRPEGAVEISRSAKAVGNDASIHVLLRGVGLLMYAGCVALSWADAIYVVLPVAFADRLISDPASRD